jgi:hypothetical protein
MVSYGVPLVKVVCQLSGSISNMPLPIPGKIDTLAALQRQMGNAVHLIAIWDTKTIARRLRPRFNGLCPTPAIVSQNAVGNRAPVLT